MLKILHLSTALPWRGGEQQLIYLYSELHKLGQTQLIVCSKGSRLEEYCISHSLNFKAIKKRGGLSLSTVRSLRDVGRMFKPDLLHAHDNQAHTQAYLLNLLYRQKIPIILSRKVEFPIKSSFLTQHKYNYSGIKKIICVSKAVKNVVSKTVVDKEKLAVVYDAVDLSATASATQEKSSFFREKFKIPEGLKIVGNVAALEESKDYFTFIDVASLLIQRNLPVKFIIMGDGAKKEELLQYAKQKGVSQEIIFSGFQDRIIDKITELDVLLTPSKQEGFCSVLLLASARGVPIVATKAGGIPEAIIAGKTGLLRDIGDSVGLAQDVEFLLTNPNARNQLIDNARERATQFSTEILGLKTLELYNATNSSCAQKSTKV